MAINQKSHAYGASKSSIREIAAYGAARKAQIGAENVFDFSLGNPSVPAPDCVRASIEASIALPPAQVHGYTPASGLPWVRERLADSLCRRFGDDAATAADLYLTCGAAASISISLHAVTNPGDEVIVIAPYFPEYRVWIETCGATCVEVMADPDTFQVDVAAVAAAVTERTKAIVVINPNNPTGAVYSREILEGIVEIARKHQLMIFADEIYDRLIMDGYEHISIASLAPDLPCVTYSGLSKSHMVCGYRVGWMVLSGNQDCMKDFILGINMLSNMRLCSNVPAQSIVQTALGGYQSVNEYIRPGGRVYEQRNYVYEALNAIDGITAVKPKAAFYIFPKMDVKKFNITDDEQFALDLLHQKKILITRGGGFNWGEPDHFRIVYLPRMEVLKESMEDLADFFAHYRQS